MSRSIPRLKPLSTSDSNEVVLDEITKFADEVERSLATQLSLPEVLATGRIRRGDIDVVPVQVEFLKPDEDVLVTHGLKSVARHFVPTVILGYGADGLRADGHVTITTGRRPPTVDGVYLRCHFTRPILKVRAEGLVWGRG